MTHSLAEYRQLAKSLAVDALALVPGPNFTRALGHSFMSHERPFVLIIAANGPSAAIVPNLELSSWDLVGFDGGVFDWRDQDGYSDAFAALAQHMPMKRLAVEGQVMRVFVHHALRQALPEMEIIDAEVEISGLRMVKTDADIAGLEAELPWSNAHCTGCLKVSGSGRTEKESKAR